MNIDNPTMANHFSVRGFIFETVKQASSSLSEGGSIAHRYWVVSLSCRRAVAGACFVA
jgi:hypothetical protein